MNKLLCLPSRHSLTGPSTVSSPMAKSSLINSFYTPAPEKPPTTPRSASPFCYTRPVQTPAGIDPGNEISDVFFFTSLYLIFIHALVTEAAKQWRLRKPAGRVTNLEWFVSLFQVLLSPSQWWCHQRAIFAAARARITISRPRLSTSNLYIQRHLTG